MMSDSGNNGHDGSASSSTTKGAAATATSSKRSDSSSSSSSSSSRLSLYFVAIGAVGIVVLILTISSMQLLETSFGSWGTSNNHAATTTTAIRVRNNNNNDNNDNNDDDNDNDNDDDEFINNVRKSNKPPPPPPSSDPDSWTDSEDEGEDEGRPTKKPTTTPIPITTSIIPIEETKSSSNRKETKKQRQRQKNEPQQQQQQQQQNEDEEVTATATATFENKKVEEFHELKVVDDVADVDVIMVKDKEEEDDEGDVDNDKDQKSSTSSTPSPSPLMESILEERTKMIAKLRKDYGNKYYEDIFHIDSAKDYIDNESDDTDGRQDATPNKLKLKYRPIKPFGPNDLYYTRHFNDDQRKRYHNQQDAKYYHSVANLQRKMMIKILRAQQQQQSSSNDGSNNDDKNNTNKNNNKYVWATGGHSAAAGHGNLYHESYTKVMERTSAAVFASVGLELEARNYAMGATSSAAEMSMCFTEIYGDDIDIFSWDFGMLEARDYLSGRMLHYATRGLLSKGFPAFVALQEIGTPRKEMLVELHEAFRENNVNNVNSDNNDNDNDNDNILNNNDNNNNNNGLALFLRDEKVWKHMKEAIPEQVGLTAPQISELPEFVRHFKCNGALEKGEPFCGDKKYSTADKDGNDACPDRMGKASWHPGWKYNAMMGNSMALFLTEMLVGAVARIEDAFNSGDYTDGAMSLLSQLEQEEAAFHKNMINADKSQLPKSHERVYWYNNTNDDWKDYPNAQELVYSDRATASENNNSKATTTKTKRVKLLWDALDREALFRGPSMCHTARLPAQTRYFGTLTNQPDMQGKEAIFGEESYFVGIEDKEFYAANAAMAQAAIAKAANAANATATETAIALKNKTRKKKNKGSSSSGSADEEETETQQELETQEQHDMRLVWVMHNERQEGCSNVVTRIDYHDFFMAEEAEGWTHLSFPNKAEQKAYGYEENKSKFKGILIIVPRFCGFGQCEKGFLSHGEYNEGKWEMVVNGEKVTALTMIGHEAILLENKDGIHFTPNDDGIYDIETKVNEPEGFIKISAFVLY